MQLKNTYKKFKHFSEFEPNQGKLYTVTIYSNCVNVTIHQAKASPEKLAANCKMINHQST